MAESSHPLTSGQRRSVDDARRALQLLGRDDGTRLLIEDAGAAGDPVAATDPYAFALGILTSRVRHLLEVVDGLTGGAL